MGAFQEKTKRVSKNRRASSLDNRRGVKQMEYIAYLHKTKASDFGVSFPDFPGCITAGKSLEEARRFAAEALGLHIKGMEEDGEAIPEPSSLDELEGDPSMEWAVAV